MESGARLRVRLTPRGGRDGLVRWEQGVLHARVAAPPIDGAANRALIELLARALHVPRSRVSLDSGDTARCKILRIEGLDETALAARIEAALRE